MTVNDLIEALKMHDPNAVVTMPVNRAMTRVVDQIREFDGHSIGRGYYIKEDRVGEDDPVKVVSIEVES